MARVASVRPTNFTLEWIRELIVNNRCIAYCWPHSHSSVYVVIDCTWSTTKPCSFLHEGLFHQRRTPVNYVDEYLRYFWCVDFLKISLVFAIVDYIAMYEAINHSQSFS